MCYFTVQAWMCLASMELWCLRADGDFGGRLGTNDLVVPCLRVVSVVTLGRKQTTWGPWLWSQAFGKTVGYKRCMGVPHIPHVCGLRFCWQVSLIRSIPVRSVPLKNIEEVLRHAVVLWLYSGETMFCTFLFIKEIYLLCSIPIQQDWMGICAKLVPSLIPTSCSFWVAPKQTISKTLQLQR